jgi:hypothetical protein
MTEADISKQRTFPNWLVVAMISLAVTSTVFVTGVTYQIDQLEKRIEYVNDRLSRKFKQ